MIFQRCLVREGRDARQNPLSQRKTGFGFFFFFLFLLPAKRAVASHQEAVQGEPTRALWGQTFTPGRR